MKIIVDIQYPEDMSYLQEEAARIVAEIFTKKLQPSEVKQLIEILKDDTKNITW